MTLTGNILITGGAGTLGRAIVQTALTQGWDAAFTIYSRSEYGQAQMRARFPRARYVLGDVRDYDRLAAVVAGHDIVIHAAAMKRIPECEAHPSECYATNVQGSVNVARACLQAGVKRCIGISTDKACRAVTAYGASKLAMEKLFQAQHDDVTTFTIVRYGNVVASRGSVIPLWRQQAANGGPITVTDRRMTRFWMSVSDAVDLVVQASDLGSGTVAIPKMGALSIVDMAHIIAPRAEITTTGLRSCEKLHEDLVHPDEQAMDIDGHYYLHPDGELGHRYTSETAPKLSADAFLRMLSEAENYE